MGKGEIKFEYMGGELIFHPKGNASGHYYQLVGSDMGFYTNIWFSAFGRPNKKNYFEVLDKYIKSSVSRTNTLLSNFQYLKDKNKESDGTV